MLRFNLEHANIEERKYIYMARDNDHAFIYTTAIDALTGKLEVKAYVFRSFTAIKVMEEVFYGDNAIVAAEKWLNGLNDVATQLLPILNKSKEMI
jgi:hypothetical protein